MDVTGYCKSQNIVHGCTDFELTLLATNVAASSAQLERRP